MACVSFKRSPVAKDLDSLSLPARSIKFSTPADEGRMSQMQDVFHDIAKVALQRHKFVKIALEQKISHQGTSISYPGVLLIESRNLLVPYAYWMMC